LIGSGITIPGVIGLGFVFKWKPELNRQYELIAQEMNAANNFVLRPESNTPQAKQLPSPK
jgi:hypothetical protein